MRRFKTTLSTFTLSTKPTRIIPVDDRVISSDIIALGGSAVISTDWTQANDQLGFTLPENVRVTVQGTDLYAVALDGASGVTLSVAVTLDVWEDEERKPEVMSVVRKQRSYRRG